MDVTEVAADTTLELSASKAIALEVADFFAAFDCCLQRGYSMVSF